MTATQKAEAVLFASGKAMEEEQLKDITGLKPKELSTALQELQQQYAEREGALIIWNEGTKWKIQVREQYTNLVKKIVAETELDRPVLETLAIIAYRSPVLQSEIIKSRGEGAYAHVSELVERGFVTKEKMARSYKLKITDKFYNYFDVEGDKDIREAFKDVHVDEEEIQKKLGQLKIVPAETDQEAMNEQKRREAQLEIYDIQQQRETDKDYLSDFDDRLGEVKSRVDTTETELAEQRKQQDELTPKEENSEEQEGTATAEDEAPPAEEKKKNPEDEDPQDFVKEINEEINDLTKGREEPDNA